MPTTSMHARCSGVSSTRNSASSVWMPGGWMPLSLMCATAPTCLIANCSADPLPLVRATNISTHIQLSMPRPSTTVSVAMRRLSSVRASRPTIRRLSRSRPSGTSTALATTLHSHPTISVSSSSRVTALLPSSDSLLPLGRATSAPAGRT